MTTPLDGLAEHRFLRGLDADTLAEIADCASIGEFAEGATILREGDPANEFHLIRTGLVAVEVEAPRRGPLVIETIGPGEILGISWLLPPYRWTFDARAVHPTGTIGIDAVKLRARIEEEPALGLELHRRFAGPIHDRLRATRLQLLDLYGQGTDR